MKTYLIYNSKSNNGMGEQGAKKVKEMWKYKEFEKEPWQKDDFEATQMPEELRERLGGMFNAD